MNQDMQATGSSVNPDKEKQDQRDGLAAVAIALLAIALIAFVAYQVI